MPPTPDRLDVWTDGADEGDDRERWRRASPRETGETLADLRRLVDAIGPYLESAARWPGFPAPRGP